MVEALKITSEPWRKNAILIKPSEVITQEPVLPTHEPMGVFKALGIGLARGVTTELPAMGGEALEFVGGKTGIESLEEFGKNVSEYFEELGDELYGTEPNPEEQSKLERWVYQGSKMLGPSLIPAGALTTGARMLLGVGKLVKGAKMAKLAGDVKNAAILMKRAKIAASRANKIGSALVAGTFGLSQAQQTIDNAKYKAEQLAAQGDYEGAKEVLVKAEGIAPYLTGAIEAGGEYLGTRYLSKLFGLTEAELLKRGVRNVVQDFLKTLGVEIGTETFQAGTQAVVEKGAGIRPDADPIAEALDVVGPTAFMTLLTGGAGVVGSSIRGQDQQPTIITPEQKQANLEALTSQFSEAEVKASIETNPEAFMDLGITKADIDAHYKPDVDAAIEAGPGAKRAEEVQKILEEEPVELTDVVPFKSAEESAEVFKNIIEVAQTPEGQALLKQRLISEGAVRQGETRPSRFVEPGVEQKADQELRERLGLPAIGDITPVIEELDRLSRMAFSERLKAIKTMFPQLEIEDAMRVSSQLEGLVEPEPIELTEVVEEPTPALLKTDIHDNHSMLLSENTILGEKPWRITHFDENQKPLYHMDYKTYEEALGVLKSTGLPQNYKVEKVATTPVPPHLIGSGAQLLESVEGEPSPEVRPSVEVEAQPTPFMGVEKEGEATPEEIEKVKKIQECPRGECLQDAVDMAKEVDPNAEEGAEIVHGLIWFESTGRYNVHAWVEKDGIVYDKSSGLELPVDEYYKRLKAKPFSRTERMDAMIRIVREGEKRFWLGDKSLDGKDVPKLVKELTQKPLDILEGEQPTEPEVKEGVAEPEAKQPWEKKIKAGENKVWHITLPEYAEDIVSSGFSSEKSLSRKGDVWVSVNPESIKGMWHSVQRMNSFASEEEVLEWTRQQGISEDSIQRVYEDWKNRTRFDHDKKKLVPMGKRPPQDLYLDVVSEFGRFPGEKPGPERLQIPPNENLWRDFAKKFIGRTDAVMVEARLETGLPDNIKYQTKEDFGGNEAGFHVPPEQLGRLVDRKIVIGPKPKEQPAKKPAEVAEEGKTDPFQEWAKKEFAGRQGFADFLKGKSGIREVQEKLGLPTFEASGLLRGLREEKVTADDIKMLTERQPTLDEYIRIFGTMVHGEGKRDLLKRRYDAYVGKEEDSPKPTYGRVFVNGQNKPFTEWREIKRGKKKGKIEVLVGKQKKRHIVDRESVKEWPEGVKDELKIVGEAYPITTRSRFSDFPFERNTETAGVAHQEAEKGRGLKIETIRAEIKGEILTSYIVREKSKKGYHANQWAAILPEPPSWNEKEKAEAWVANQRKIDRGEIKINADFQPTTPTRAMGEVKKRRYYLIGIDKAYFPEGTQAKEQFGTGLWEKPVKILAPSRTEAANLAWEKHGERWLSAMKPHEGRLPRKVSLQANEPKAGVGGKLGRLHPVTVYGGTKASGEVATFTQTINKAIQEKPSGILSGSEQLVADTEGHKITVPVGERIKLENALFTELQDQTGELGGTVTQTGSGLVGSSVFEIERPYGKLIYNEETGELTVQRADLLDRLETSLKNVKFGVDKTLLLQTVSKDIVNNDLAGTIANETIQNALDSFLKNQTKNIKITTGGVLEDDAEETLVTIEDNGKGMSTRQVEKNLLRLGARGKGGKQSIGGYGLAKAGFLLTPKFSRVTTVKNGVKTILEGTREQFFGVKGAGNPTLATYDAPGEPNGTKFELRFFRQEEDARNHNAFELTPWAIDNAFSKYIKKGVLVDGVNFTFDAYSHGVSHHQTQSPASLEKEFPSDKVELMGNVASIHYVKDPNPNTWKGWQGKYSLNIDTYNKGLALFGIQSRTYSLEGMQREPTWKIVVNFEKTTDVRSRDYPFIRNRTELNHEISKQISDLVNKKIEKINNEEYELAKEDFREMVESSPVVNGIRILIPFKSQNEFDEASERVLGASKLISDLTGIFNSFKSILGKIGGKDVELAITVDPNVHGYRSNPNVTGYELYAINPFAVTETLILSPEYMSIVDAGYDSHTAMASNLVHTLVHEYTHNEISEHAESFTLKLAENYLKISHTQLARLEQQARRFYEEHEENLRSLQSHFSRMGEGGSKLSDNSIAVYPTERTGAEPSKQAIQALRHRRPQKQVERKTKKTPEQWAKARVKEIQREQEADVELQAKLKGALKSELKSSDKAGRGPAWKKELFDSKDKGWISRVVDEIDDVRKHWQTRIVDRLHPIKTLIGDTAYMLHRLETGIQGVMATFMRHGIPKWDGKAMTVDTRKQGFLEWYRKLGKDGERLLYWIVAKRAEKLEQEFVKVRGEERPKEILLTEEERKKIFDWVGDKPKSGGSWRRLHKQFNKYNKGVLDLAEHAGLINSAARKQWEQHFYVPFYRIFENEETKEEFLRGPVQSKKHIDAQIRRLVGSERKLGDPLENVIRSWTHLIHESMRNVARAEAFNTAQDLGLNIIEKVDKKDLTRILGTKTQNRYAVMKEGAEKASAIFDIKEEAEAWSYHLEDKYNKKYTVSPRKTTVILFGNMKDHNILSFQDKGERVYFRVNDAELFNAMSNINQPKFNNIIMRMFRFSKRALTYGATFGPAFRIANMLRDTLHTAIISKSFVPFWDSAKGFAKAMREDSDYVKFAASGAAFGSSYVKADDAQILAKFIKEVTKREGKGAVDRILDTPRKLLRMWEKIGAASENAARVSLYTTRIKEGNEHLNAAFESRDLLDFTMKGDAAAVQFLIQLVPFMNARMQGLYKLGRSAKESPISFGTKGGLLTLASLLLWAMNKDKDEWKELEDWDRWTYYHFWIGDKHYRIPKPFEVGAIFSSMFESAADSMSDNEEIKYFGDFLKHTLWDTLAFNPAPQLVKPLMEQWANKSFFTGRPIEGQSLQALKSGERKDVWTSETAQLAGKLGISPKRAEALVRGYFSTVGMFALGISDSIVHHLGDFPSEPTKRIGEYPVFGRFIKERKAPRQSKHITRFYETMKEMDALVGTINHYKRIGDIEKARDLSTKHKEKLKYKKRFNKIRSRLREINRRIRKVYHSTKSPDEKRAELDRLTEKRNKTVNKVYHLTK